MKICGIYKITNIKTGKSYIGQSCDIETRFQQHKVAKDNFAIHLALRKYGIENFSFEIIEKCSIQEVIEREKYWIEFYDTYKNGYNETPGGEGVCEINKRSVNQYDLEGNFLKTFSSITEAEEELQIKYRGSNINLACEQRNGRMTALGFQWRYADSVKDNQNIGKIEKPIDKSRKIIQQYDKNNNFIQEFKNITDAAVNTGISRTSISNALNGYSKSAGGYLWKKVL